MQKIAHYVIVDWLSYTAKLERGASGESSRVTLARVNQAIEPLLRLVPALALCQDELAPGRKPYSASFSAHNITVFFSPRQDTVLVEASGKGCEWLRSQGLLDKVLALTNGRATRLDIAVDFETDLDPREFAKLRTDRIKSEGFQSSASGVTCYVGSQSSDRYARVYRYYEPHPRAQYLRVEMVHRRSLARGFVQLVRDEGLEKAAEMAGACFSWGHPIWDTQNSSKPPSWRSETRQGGTVSWFWSAVVPAVRRLLDDGTLTVEEVQSALFELDAGGLLAEE